MMPGKGSKYREFYDLSGRIMCMLSSGQFSQIISRYLLMFAQISNRLDFVMNIGFCYVHIIWLILLFAVWCHF